MENQGTRECEVAKELECEKLEEEQDQCQDEVTDYNDCQGDCEGDNDDGDGEENGEPRFSSPEAGAERLENLPPGVLDSMRRMRVPQCFSMLIDELKSRCQTLRSDRDMIDFERMWTHMVLNNCQVFRLEHFKERPDPLEQAPTSLCDFMASSSVVCLLQTFNDLTQQDGFKAKQNLNALTDENSTRRVTERQLDDARDRCRELQQLYRDCVRLFQMCTGTWRPRPNRRSFGQRNQQDSNQQGQNQQWNNQGRGGQQRSQQGNYSQGQSNSQSRQQYNGQSNGQSNGQYRGQSNGQSNGQYRGQSNGQYRGQSNGQFVDRKSYQPGTYQGSSQNDQGSQRQASGKPGTYQGSYQNNQGSYQNNQASSQNDQGSQRQSGGGRASGRGRGDSGRPNQNQQRSQY